MLLQVTLRNDIRYYISAASPAGILFNNMTIIEKLAKAYYQRKGSVDQEFFSWLSSTGVEPTEKSLKELLEDIDDYV